MNENYTKGIKKILEFAKDEALRLSDVHVGSEHILLGVIKDPEGKGAKTLETIGCDLKNVKVLIEKNHPEKNRISTITSLPFTSRGKRKLKNSFQNLIINFN